MNSFLRRTDNFCNSFAFKFGKTTAKHTLICKYDWCTRLVVIINGYVMSYIPTSLVWLFFTSVFLEAFSLLAVFEALPSTSPLYMNFRS